MSMAVDVGRDQSPLSVGETDSQRNARSRDDQTSLAQGTGGVWRRARGVFVATALLMTQPASPKNHDLRSEISRPRQI